MKKRIILSVVLLTTIHANAFAQPFIVADGEVKMNQAYFASDAQANTDSDTTYVSPISDTNIESVQNTVDPSTDVVAENQDEASPISDTDPVFYFGPNGEIQFSSAANAPTIDEMVKTNKRNEDIVAEDKTDVVIPTISTGSGVKNSTGSIITPPEKKPEVKKQDTSTGATKKSVVTQGLFATEGATRKFYSIHTGADYRIRYRDMSVPFDSKVVFAGFEPGWGNVVGLKSKVGNIFLVLGHFNNFGKDIVPGADVKKGTYLGKTGNTGNTTGPHLHVELYKDGVPQDEYVQIRFLGDFFSGSDNPKLNPPEKWNTKHIRTMIAEAGLYSPMYAPFFDKIEAKEKETGVPERYLFSLRVASGKPIDEVADLLLTSGKFQPKIDDIKASKANVLSFVSCLNARYLMGYDFDCTLPRYKKGMDAFISSMDDLYTSQTTKVANVTNPVDNSKDVANSTPSVTLNGTKVVLDNPNPPKIEDNTPIRSDKKKNILSWIDSNVSDDKKLIGCYLK